MMRRTAAVLTACLATVLVAPEVSAAPNEKVVTHTYKVTGSTAQEIRASLNANGPGNYDARTTWRVWWSYGSVQQGSECVVTSHSVHSKIVFLYPKWKAPADAAEALVTKWKTYMAALHVHENGHAKHGRVTARRINKTFASTVAANCSALDSKLRSKIDKHFARGNAADVRYDAKTNHGATQGATFP
jgi:predicted secreted Zn-dependent protease